jgi:hypothetical protein
MKIKHYYYCLTDSNNKPDFRYLFTNRKDAERKRRQIKNSSQGETLFVSKHRRDFFIDGIKKDFIDREKLINIKKGCWVKLKTKKVSLVDTIKPEIYFQKTIRSVEIKKITNIQTQSKRIKQPTITRQNTQSSTANTIKQKANNISSNHKQSDKQHSPQSSQAKRATASAYKKNLFNFIVSSNHKSIFQTKLFMVNFAIVLLIVTGTTIYFNNKSNKEILTALAKKQSLVINKEELSGDDLKNEVAVLGAKDKKNIINADNNDNQEIDDIVLNTLQEFEKIKADKLEEKILQMVAGTPMEKMAPYIAKKDKKVAAFLVGIAKKESNYGRRVPVLNGQDCFNYWGYRGIRKRMGTGGHTCFDSPEDAVNTVGGRIERLIKSGVDTPQEMVLWKCGSDCNATGGQAAANKWIRDVNMYFSKMLKLTEEKEDDNERA